jgi:hypothetical protein
VKPAQEDEFEGKYIKYFVLTMAAAIIVMATLIVLTDDSKTYIEITRDTKIANRIKKMILDHSTLYLDFDNKAKYRISSRTTNYAYERADIGSFATGGDWVEKTVGSDTIKIMREARGGGVDYFIFVLGAELNRDLDKK